MKNTEIVDSDKTIQLTDPQNPVGLGDQIFAKFYFFMN